LLHNNAEGKQMTAASVLDRLKRRLGERAIEEDKPPPVSRTAYAEACVAVSELLEQYELLAQRLLPPAPNEKLVSNLQTVSRWEAHKRRDELGDEYQKYRKKMKILWPGWSPFTARREAPLDDDDKGQMSPMGRLYGDTLQSVLVFMDAAELAACMMVSHSWMAVAKRPRVWTGKVLHIANKIVPGMSTLYTAPWTSLALQYVEGVVVISSRPYDTYRRFGSSFQTTPCYLQLLTALRHQTLPNIRRVCIIECAADVTRLVQSLAENRYVEEVVVGDFVDSGSFNARISLLQSMPNLRVAKLTTFHDLNRWSSGDYWRGELCWKIIQNQTLRHLVVSLENTEIGLRSTLERLYGAVSTNPALKTLEIQIYGKTSAACTVAAILKHCGKICDKLDLLHIRQFDRLGYTETTSNLNTAFHLVGIRGALLETVLLEKSKMRVQIELLAGALTIKRYRKMLRELPADAAELAKERVWVRPVKTNSVTKEGSLLHLV
jgi:hypothetical protein